MALRDRLQQIKNSADAKVLASNFAWLSVMQVASYIFPLFTYPYLARVIGVDGFGRIAFAAAIMVWISTVADWGFNFTATRDVSKHRENIGKVSEIFSNVLWARLSLMIISFCVLIILIIAVPVFRNDYAVILITFLMIPGHICCPEWFFQAIQRMKYITYINVGVKLFFTICVFIFIHKPSDYLYQPLLISIGYFISGIFAFYLIVNRWGIKIYKPDIKVIFHTIKGSTDVFVNNIFPNLYNSLSSVLLGFWGGAYANGILSAGQQVVNIANNFLVTISRTFFPYLSRTIDKHTSFAKMYIGVAIVIAVVLFLAAPLAIHILYTTDFDNAINVMRILAISLVFSVMSNVYGSNYLIVVGKERILRNITIVCSVLGLLMAIPLVYYFTYIGAAITVCTTRILLGVASMWATKYIQKLDREQI